MPHTTPIFDLDDLSFFRWEGLGLRHVGLEQALKECKEGSHRGDAVSLANYGFNVIFRGKAQAPLFSTTICEDFQRKVETFINSSFKDYHQPNQHYQDAAFMLMSRGTDARLPKDFDSYSLGKCGTKAFLPETVLLHFTTVDYEKEGLIHATSKALMDLSQLLRAYKIQMMETLLTSLENPHEVLTAEQCASLSEQVNLLLGHYRQNTFITSAIYSSIQDLAGWTTEKRGDFDQAFLFIKEAVAAIKVEQKKGEESIEFIYKLVSLEQLEEKELTNFLFKSIYDQNYPRVLASLKLLPKDIFSKLHSNALYLAAEYPDVRIAQAIYEHEPQYFQSLFANPDSNSAVAPAVSEGYQPMLQYFLSLHPLTPHSLKMGTREDALSRQTSRSDQNAYEIIQLLIESGAVINSANKNIYQHPFARAAVSVGKWQNQILNLMIKSADLHAKYMGLLSATTELCLIYENKNDQSANTPPDFPIYVASRQQIFNSLTLDECKIMAGWLAEGAKNPCCRGESFLKEDLLKNELKSARQKSDSSLVKKILICCQQEELVEEFGSGLTLFNLGSNSLANLSLSSPSSPSYQAHQ